MEKNLSVKGVIFDYGGTLDTNGEHWSEVLWRAYRQVGVPVEKEAFRDAYVYAERALAKHPYIKPTHNFRDILLIKVGIQLGYLKENEILNGDFPCEKCSERIADTSYQSVLNILQISRNVVEKLHEKHKLILVSNFYGNIETVLTDFGLLCFFEKIIESAVVGVRKPDPAIYRLGVEAMGFAPDEIAVVGDSFSKDMVPASKVGCHTVWLKGKGWVDEQVDESLPDVVITDISQLIHVFGCNG